MARQGNYVSVPGGSANWASGISGSLSDLSKSLIGQAVKKDERADMLAQREFQNKRIREEDARVAKDRELLKQVNLFSNKDPSTLTYDISDYGAEQQDAINNARRSLEAERSSTQQFLNTGNKESLENALSVYEKNINLTNLPAEAKAAKIAERRNRLLAFGREAQGEGYSADQRSERIKSLVADLYDPQFSRLDDTIKRGVGLTQEGQFRAFARQLPDDVASRFSRDELKNKFGSMLSAQSRDEILAAENARVAAANERAKEQIDLLDKYYMRVNQGKSSGYSGKRTGKDVLAAYGKISGMDIGPLDDARLVEQLDRLLDNENIDPMAAAAAITLGVDRGILSDGAYSVDDKEFLDIQERALALSGGGNTKTFKGSKKGPSLSDYQYTPAKARDLGDLLRSRVVLAGGGDYRLGVKDNYLEQLEAITAKNDKPAVVDNRTQVPDVNTQVSANTVLPAPSIPQVEQQPVSISPMNPLAIRRNRRGNTAAADALRTRSLQNDRLATAERITELRNALDANNAQFSNPNAGSLERARAEALADDAALKLDRERRRLIEIQNALGLR